MSPQLWYALLIPLPTSDECEFVLWKYLRMLLLMANSQTVVHFHKSRKCLPCVSGVYTLVTCSCIALI